MLLALKAIAVDEMTQNNGHDAAEGHSKSHFWYLQKPIRDFLLVNIITYILSCTVSKITWQNIFYISTGF